ncbi:MAG: DegT/DnrJ/EryC1/StrS family aminotransferase [Myxococcales bacterium]|nr:DegT/DnrJ/EryC1/StrS family aminotransferase [Myxococcales bacterium]
MAKLALKGGKPVWTKGEPEWPVYDDRERKALEEVLVSRNWGGFPAPNVKAREFAERFASFQDAEFGIAAANGTVTLETCLRAADIQAGDEVIVTPYTWVATAATAVNVNAVPIFADVSPDNYCLDPDAVEAAITPRSRAVIPVHLGSNIADLDRLKAICEKHDLVLIEDCAHAHGGKWRDKGVGSHGDFGSFSMQSSKIMTAGEGGMITTNDRAYYEKCQSFVNCGRKESGYNSFEGRLLGGNHRISEWQAAVLLCQLERLPEQTKVKKANMDRLAAAIDEVEGLSNLKVDSRVTTQPCYQFIFKFHADQWGGVHKDRFCEAMTAEGVEVDSYFYIPLYDNALFAIHTNEYPELKRVYGDPADPKVRRCPNAEKAAYEEALWLHHPYLLGDKADVDLIIEAIHKVRANLDELR